MKYTVMQDFYVAEFNGQLFAGEAIEDGEIEPDLMANLVARGVVEPDMPKPVKKAAAKAEKETDVPLHVPTQDAEGE